MVNFDNDVARHFFVQNIVYLAREYPHRRLPLRLHPADPQPNDGNIRLRGSGGGWQFLREVREKVKAVDPGILLIAEELPNTWQVTAEERRQPWAGDRHGPFDAQWADPFHDHFKRVLTGQHLDTCTSVFTNFGDSWQDARRLRRVARRGRQHRRPDRQARARRQGLGDGAARRCRHRPGPRHSDALHGPGGGRDDAVRAGRRQAASANPGTGHTWWDDRLPLGAYESGRRAAKGPGLVSQMFEIRQGDPDGRLARRRHRHHAHPRRQRHRRLHARRRQVCWWC